jgi:hypothetical protein
MSGWRTLTDDELFALSQENERRCNVLAGKGAQLFGIDTHYLILLLEEQMSDRAIAAARETHHLWLAERLDQVEGQVRDAEDKLRQQALMQGVSFGNGHP